MSAATKEKEAGPVEIFRKDYMQPANFVKEARMDFGIEEGKTTVKTELLVEKNSNSKHSKGDLVLDGGKGWREAQTERSDDCMLLQHNK